MPEHYSTDQVKGMLCEYNDIPGLILEQSAMIKNIRQHGVAEKDVCEEEIARCTRRIAELRAARDRIETVLDTLDHTDRQILQLAYIGPSDPVRRRGWRPPTWKEIAVKVDYSESRVKQRAQAALKRLSEI